MASTPTVYTPEKLAALGIAKFDSAEVVEAVNKLVEFSGETVADLNSFEPGFLIDYLSKRIIDEIVILSRLMKVNGSFRPEWYDPDVDTPIEALTLRSELSEDFPQDLEERFEISTSLAQALTDCVGLIVKGYVEYLEGFHGL